MSVWADVWADVWNDVWASEAAVSNSSPLLADVQVYSMLDGAGLISSAISASPNLYPALAGDPNANELLS